MRKFTLFIVSMFIAFTAMAQTPVLKLRNFGSTVPYQLSDEEAAKVFAMSDLTVSIDVNIPATAWNNGTRAALFCTSSPSTAANTSSKGMNSAYVAYGLSYANSTLSLGYLASCVGGDRFTKGNIAWGTENVVLTCVVNPTANTCKLFINGEKVSSWENSHPDGFMEAYEIASPAMVKEDYADACIYIGAGVTSAGNFEAFNGTINAVNVYDGVLSDEEIANIDLYEEERAEALAIVDGIEGKIGYPVNSVIENYKTAVNEAADLADIEAAKQALYNSTEINLPVDGKAYTFTFVQKEGAEHYMNCSGTDIEAPVQRTADAIIPYTAVFVAEVNEDGTFAFKTYNGKYIKNPKDTQNLSDTETNDTKISISKILDSGTGNVAYVYAPNDDNSCLFGMVHMARNGRSFVVKGSNGQWDGSSAAHYEKDGDNATAGRVFSTAVRIEEVKGAYYRLKNVGSSWYATSNMCEVEGYTDKLAMEAAGNTPQSIWYRTYDDKLLSYAKGQYLGDFAQDGNGWTFEEVGVAGNYATFHAGATTGTYQIRPSNGRALYGDDKRVDAAGSGNNNANYNWTLEEVTSLPVTIKASAKYATFHAPVAVSVPEGVTAHTVTINGEWATLSETPLTVIPANTAVILHAEGIAEDTEFDFTITTSEPFSGNNALSGTVAAEYATTEKDVFVLANVEGNVGLYKAETATSFTLKGHAAYLALDKADPANNSVGYRFGFDGTTAVEKVEMRNEKEEIYDLQGRRINEITEPGIYIVNGVKVLVK